IPSWLEVKSTRRRNRLADHSYVVALQFKGTTLSRRVAEPSAPALANGCSPLEERSVVELNNCGMEFAPSAMLRFSTRFRWILPPVGVFCVDCTGPPPVSS